MIPHDDSMLELVAAHALGAIDAASAECQAVREHLRTCATCREEYRIASAAAAAVGMSASETPPPQLRERVLRALPPRVAAPAIVPLRRSRAWFVGVGTAAAVLLAAAIWFAQQHRVSMWAAACVPTAVNCHASGLLTMSGPHQLHLDVTGLPDLPAGKAYQAWVIVPGSAPKPEPVLKPTAQGGGSVDIPFTPPKGTIVALTVEPAGGSSQPTSKPFLTATVQ